MGKDKPSTKHSHKDKTSYFIKAIKPPFLFWISRTGGLIVICFDMLF
jgi:hypothetical protein